MVAQPNYGLSTDTTLGGNSPSDIINPSEKAIKTYVDGRAISNLSDVTTTTPTTGQVLEYDGSAWVNAANTTVTFRDWSTT